MSMKIDERATVIREIKTPLGLLALISMVFEIVLVLLARRAQGSDLTIIIVGTFFIMSLVLVCVVVLYWNIRPRSAHSVHQTAGEESLSSLSRVDYISSSHADANAETQQAITNKKLCSIDLARSAGQLKCHIFLSVPMAAYKKDNEYEKQRQQILQLIGNLKHSDYNKIFYAGENIESQKDFDPADTSVVTDFQYIANSEYFVLIYPKKIQDHLPRKWVDFCSLGSDVRQHTGKHFEAKILFVS